MVLIDVESENGWRPADCQYHPELLVWKTIPGTDPPVNVQVMRGLPEVILIAWAADWNEFIEHVTDEDTASFTKGNTVYTSNHKNGTGIDICWNRHPFEELSFTPQQLATMAEMEAHYEGWVFWSGRWQSPIDQMHSQMGYNTWNRNTAALDFMARKIRSDGFSTFRRGALSATDPPRAGGQPEAPTPQVPDEPVRDEVDSTDSITKVLYDAIPVIDEERAAELADEIVLGLALSGCRTIPSIAMWLAQVGHESDGFATTEEYAKNGRYAPYIGRTWIQVTWLENYRGFGKWAFEQGFISDPEYFVKNPQRLADEQWAALGAVWYITVARPQLPAMFDAGDVLGVTKVINGGTNHLDDRRDRYNQALALGDRLLLLIDHPTEEEGPLMALTDDEQRELLTKTREIWDQLRGPAAKGWPQLGGLTPVDAIAEVKLDVAALQTPTSQARRKAIEAKKTL